MIIQQMCGMLIGIARTCGIEVVRDLNVNEYQEFLEERKLVVDQQRKDLQDAREAKMLRTG